LSKIGVADLNADGYLDVVTANCYANSVSVLLGMPGGQLGTSTFYATDTGPSHVAVGDVNSDGRPDIITANGYNSFPQIQTISVLLATSGGFATKTDYALSSRACGLALGDVTGDGLADIVIGTMPQVTVLPQAAGGGFTSLITYPSPVSSPNLTGGNLLLQDVNADGHLDLITSGVTVSLGRAGGGFGNAITYPAGARPVAGDLNNDGMIDLVTTGPRGGTFSVLLGQAGGTFGTRTDYQTAPAVGSGSSPFDIALGDITGDGRLDVITVDPYDINIAVIPGQAGGFGPPTLYSSAWGVGGVVAADINGDGRTDVVTGNVGTASVFLNQAALSASVGLEKEIQVQLFPSPAHGAAVVQLPAVPRAAIATLTLLDALGRTARSEQASLPATGLRHEFNLTGLVPGVYALRVQAGEDSAVRRLVVE